MSYARLTASAHTPWESSSSVETPCGEPAPTQEAAYTCGRGCTFQVTFAADAVPPPAWDCRCGAAARLDEAPPGASAEVRLPGYTIPGGHELGGPISHWQQVLGRRSRAELEALLAEQLAARRGVA